MRLKILSRKVKDEDLIEKSEDDVVVGDITRFVKEFKMDVERKIEILSVYMDVESRDSKKGMAEKVQAMRDKAEDLIEEDEDVGDITRFVKEFRVDVERKITPYTEKKNKKRYTDIRSLKPFQILSYNMERKN